MPGLAEQVARRSLQLLEGYTSRFVATSVGRVHVMEVEGNGDLPPLLMLHGLSSAGVHFLPLLRHVRQFFSRLIIPDLPGHGFSDTPKDFAGVHLRTGLVEALDVLTAPSPVLLFGNSLGGYGAIRYALARPERVTALLLASPGGAQMTATELEHLYAHFRLEDHADALALIDRLLARKQRVRRHLYAAGLRRQLRRMEVNAILSAATDEHLLTAEEVGSISHPVLFMWGQKERVLPARHLSFFREHLPAHAEIREPREWGHSPFLDDPRSVAQHMVGFAYRVTRLA